jgi:16S rRNA (cytosine1402-N4)-methyltransferase
MGHTPVLLGRVVELLVPALEHGGVFVDGTLGLGGHAQAILERAPRAELVGIDRDPGALATARANLAPYQERVRLLRDNFESIPAVLERLGVEEVRGVLLDLGVSSPQLDEAHRGFSFRGAGPLDMRMDPEQPLMASTVVNEYAQRDLAAVIRRYGEERFASRVAAAIVKNRPIRDTTHLAEVVKEAIPAATRRTGGHPARRTFQALRLEVNRELEALESVLPGAILSLAPGGRLVVISYHSLEDRIAKRTFAEAARGCVCPPDFPVCVCGAEAKVRLLTRRPVRPDDAEIADNPRASAAKLRAVEKLGTAA